jgi:hypothetical protein
MKLKIFTYKCGWKCGSGPGIRFFLTQGISDPESHLKIHNTEIHVVEKTLFKLIQTILSINQCCGSGSERNKDQNFLQDPDP